MTQKVPVVAIDGPAASGKGTLAKQLAEQLGWHLLDSGLLYRIVGLLATEWGVPLDRPSELTEQIKSRLDLVIDSERVLDATPQDTPSSEASTRVQIYTDDAEQTLVFYDDKDVTEALRSRQISSAASQVAQYQEVRESLIPLQHAFRRLPGLVADGRDMGTVVFPDADLKIYLTADVIVRAQRRFAEIVHTRDVVLSEVILDLKRRDALDMEREIAPLQTAEGAITIDNTGRSIAEVVEEVLQMTRSLFPHNT